MRKSIWLLILGLSGTCLSASPKIDFNTQVRPILSDRCYLCHGMDGANRKADLRLDTREGALAAIVPGNPDSSELMKRIISTDPDEIMPPPTSHLTMTPDEISVLRQWIAEGAEYQAHWAFLPIAARPMPAITRPMTHEIDTWVQARLEKEGLAFQPEASRERLLRRVSLDLTGLPPTVEELDAFLADTAPGAYERQVDRLLASSAFGERMAVDWLDVARYADTFGYQSDVDSPVWPYRDYVIRAFNENKPFDRFIMEQLGGDLLENPTREQLVATAFNRLHRQTNEGGSIEEEFRVEYVKDRVNTFGLAFLGLTMECAQCHDHKYDPIRQKDYFQLFAFFQNIDESGLYSHFTNAIPTPTLTLTSAEQEKMISTGQAQLKEAQAAWDKQKNEREATFQAWRQSAPALDRLAMPEKVLHYLFDQDTSAPAELKSGQEIPNQVANAPAAKTSDLIALKPGISGQALHLNGENNVNFTIGGEWTRDDAFSYSLWVQAPEVKERAMILHRSEAWTDAGSNGYELMLDAGRLSGALIHFWPGNALRVTTREKFPLGRWVHVAMTYDGSSLARGLRLYIDGQEAAVEIVRDALTKDINRGEKNKSVSVGQRFRDRGLKDGLIDELHGFQRALSPLEVRVLAGQMSAPSEAEWREYYFSAVDEPVRAARQSLFVARRALSQSHDQLTEIMIMRELPTAKPAYILNRGAYDARGESVAAESPAFLPPMKKDEPRHRLGLARWLTQPDHPLTARVIVNRLWHSLFGRGLVATPEDFGLQGQLPSHPELLDALADRFIKNGWDFKDLVKHIVTAQAYRQDSTSSEEAQQKDPENKWLGRGPRFRLMAEMVRDQALLAAGQLDRTIGGPSVDPDQTTRRSLYTYWKRTMPDVRMEIFDMAKREVCVARRQTTNTPLQALTLLNEPRFNQMAQQLAERIAQKYPQNRRQQQHMIFRTLTSRQPSEREQSVLAQLYTEQKAHFSGDELKALSAVALALFSFDETMMKR
jgi:hypothetical protein